MGRGGGECGEPLIVSPHSRSEELYSSMIDSKVSAGLIDRKVFVPYAPLFDNVVSPPLDLFPWDTIIVLPTVAWIGHGRSNGRSS